ncbi:hypothetical protein CDL12_22100 [Handroanthus impetiginosus]|uniref:Auxin-responsive protein n=1 Tax=Handroanthus impetiginosus TaxID=429701 RepID=A0A2G9GJA4_9LAMI|nr:hypothetical protein CDL12_22100 [Handroanthus impetiginosus]
MQKTFLSSRSMSTLSREDSNSFPDDSELELGLGLSLGGGKGKAPPPPAVAGGGGSWISTKASSSSSSSSCSAVSKANNNGSCGTKRTAEPSSPPGRQVVGWPPIGTYRINSLVNHAKSPATEESASTVDKCKNIDKADYHSRRNNNAAKERGLLKTSLFVKVNMDGIPIGRKVDLNAHSCYKTLACTLDHMFRLDAAIGARRSIATGGAGGPTRLLDGSSDFVLTYEDKDGDWMLVGDVPWEMFLGSVRRLRIRRTTEANGLVPISPQRNRRQ